mgnify:CR=1 FL=1
MRKIEDFETFAAALSFYMFTAPYVLSKSTTKGKYEAVAKNIQCVMDELL